MILQLSWRWSSSGLCILTLLSPKTKARGHCALWDTSICAQVPRTCAAKMWLMPQRFDRITLHKSRASKIEVRASPIILGHYVTHIETTLRCSHPTPPLRILYDAASLSLTGTLRHFLDLGKLTFERENLSPAAPHTLPLPSSLDSIVSSLWEQSTQ